MCCRSSWIQYNQQSRIVVRLEWCVFSTERAWGDRRAALALDALTHSVLPHFPAEAILQKPDLFR
jgi:hypothetical protein